MSDNSAQGPHNYRVSQPYTQGRTAPNSHPGKKEFDHKEVEAGSSDGSSTHEASSGQKYAFIKKMCPGMSDKDAERFMQTMEKSLTREFQKAAERSKKAKEVWNENDQ